MCVCVDYIYFFNNRIAEIKGYLQLVRKKKSRKIRKSR